MSIMLYAAFRFLRFYAFHGRSYLDVYLLTHGCLVFGEVVTQNSFILLRTLTFLELQIHWLFSFSHGDTGMTAQLPVVLGLYLL
jgi:hypothetical protein